MFDKDVVVWRGALQVEGANAVGVLNGRRAPTKHPYKDLVLLPGPYTYPWSAHPHDPFTSHNWTCICHKFATGGVSYELMFGKQKS